MPRWGGAGAGGTSCLMEAPPPAPPPRSPLRRLPQPVSTSPSTLSKRQHALHELMSSERAYASDLTLILEVHIPLARPHDCRRRQDRFWQHRRASGIIGCLLRGPRTYYRKRPRRPRRHGRPHRRAVLTVRARAGRAVQAVHHPSPVRARPPHRPAPDHRAHRVPPKNARPRRVAFARLGLTVAAHQARAKTIEILFATYSYYRCYGFNTPRPPASCERTHRHGGRRALGERGPPPRRGRQGGPHRAQKTPHPPAHQVLPCPPSATPTPTPRA
ncbi:hypothetical protein B0H14DRAFT_1058687 [Mycena olivaceomarginata]|nr:hypothetical protein B0H14DRAFT_1058687 [Mycena olivaceomarginata]